MSDALALSPEEAATIAANVYFLLDNWEAVYQFKETYGSDAKGAPSAKAGIASTAVINKNVFGSGPASLAKTDLAKKTSFNAFSGSTGSNLFGRTKTGFGYFLQFNRGNKNHLVIAVRGTRPELGYPDLLSDANAGFNRYMKPIGPVHSGFYDIYDSILNTLTGAHAVIKNADVVHCVGHSLGGAVANLVALHVQQLNSNVRLYTFGAPRVGTTMTSYDKQMNNYIGENNIYRVSHNCDPIAMIPIMPYIHALPSVKDKNNFFIGSPTASITIDNHDIYNYINSVRGKDWISLGANKLQQGYLDQQYFESWRSSDNWLKQYLGFNVNFSMAILQRILRGILNVVSLSVVACATILDVLALFIKTDIAAIQATNKFMTKFILDCARMLGMAAAFTLDLIIKLYRKLQTEMAIIAKQALAAGTKIANSTEFRIALATAVPGSIGLLFI